MDAPEPLEVAAWRQAVGHLRSEDLPELATAALVRGLDSYSLRLLAGQRAEDVRESADLLRAAVEELGISTTDAESAHWNLSREAARQIVAGETSPALGAGAFRNAYTEVHDPGDLRIFVGLLSMLDDFPEEAPSIEHQIVAEAQQLLDREAPRVWIRLCAVLGSPPLTQTYGSDDVGFDATNHAVSQPLSDRLAAWDCRFQETFASWPQSGGFASVGEAEAFVEEGQALTMALQEELGDRYVVEYMPEPTRPPGLRLRRRRLLRWLR